MGKADSTESWRRTLKVGATALALMVVCGLGFRWRYVQLGVAEDVPDSLVWYTATQLGLFLSAIKASGRTLYGLTQLSLDVAFPLAYAALLAVLIERLWRTRDIGLLWLAPLLAACFDLGENLILAFLAFSFTPDAGMPAPVLVRIAATLTLAKFVSLGVSLLLLGGVCSVSSPRWVRWLGLPWLVLVGWLLSRSVALLLAGLLAVLLLGIVVHRKWAYLFQYLFFMRFILLGAAGLLGFPWAARSIGHGLLLGNLLVVEGLRWGDEDPWLRLKLLVLVSFLVGILTMTLLWCTRLAILTIAARCKLLLSREDKVAAPADSRDMEQANRYRFELMERNRGYVRSVAGGLVPLAPLVFGLVGVPFLYEIWLQSRVGRRWWDLAAALALVAGVGLWIAVAYGIRRVPSRWSEGLTKWLGGSRPTWIGNLMQPGAEPLLGFGGQGHLGVILFIAFVSVCYALLGAFLSPASRRFPDGFPAIGFVLLIASVAVWGLTILALILDRPRVPVILALMVVLFGVHRARNNDDYFDVVAAPAAGLRVPTATEAFDAWQARNASADFVTVVAASGGGIKASLWTARVLQALAEEKLGRSIVLMSTNSGGSVGGMYFTDAFRDGEPPDERKMERVVRLAGASSLAACAWAMAYRDLWSFLSGGLLPSGPRTHDRGWAIDRRWEARRARLDDHDHVSSEQGHERPRRLGEWAEDVRSGHRPAHIFNATVVETGAPFRFGSVDLSSRSTNDAPGSRPQEFWDFFGAASADIEVATAARLSASFPWVSPMARAWAEPAPRSMQARLDAKIINSERAFRLGDGGYFDNFGVYSAIEFLRDIGPAHMSNPKGRVRSVLFVQIRATPEGPAAMKPGGIQYSLVGPIIAMNSVRNSSQIARNDLELGLLQQVWAADKAAVRIVPVVFDLRQPGPLSWHLTREERDRVSREGWGAPEERALQTALHALREAGAPPGPSSGVQ